MGVFVMSKAKPCRSKCGKRKNVGLAGAATSTGHGVTNTLQERVAREKAQAATKQASEGARSRWVMAASCGELNKTDA
jgi:hypothetical protein